MKRILFPVVLAILLLTGVNTKAQFYYWVAFTDKTNTPWSLSYPEAFLSERAIQRREKQNIAIDSLDLPVDPIYVDQVLKLGASLIHSSKWMNGITVMTETDSFATKVMQLPFVKEVQLTKRSLGIKSAVDKFADPVTPGQILEIDTTEYGSSAYQVSQLNGQFLHNQDFKGQGIHIAVLDAGFYKADKHSAFDSLWADSRVLGTKDFVSSDSDLFEGHYHGMSVLSIMAGNIRGELIGTAPKASYWLIRSEDTGSEFLIEEDNWVVAAEFADSVGADIINSSLGYFVFDDSTMNHTYAEIDGQTTRVTRAANIAASRGMLVFASAGNEGSKNNTWKYIIAPSDGDSVIGVGAVNKEGAPAPFTSSGPAFDGDVKPNVTALGWNTVIQKSDGTVGTGNGTSYSSPVIAGMAACLWQANPHASAFHIKNSIEQSAHLYNSPDSLLGHGIPDMMIADQILKTSVLKKLDKEVNWFIYPNPVSDYIILQKHCKTVFGKVQIAFYSTDGRLLRQEVKPDASKIILQNIKSLEQGLLLLQIRSGDVVETGKIIKIP